jgi:hypothetical protein
VLGSPTFVNASKPLSGMARYLPSRFVAMLRQSIVGTLMGVSPSRKTKSRQRIEPRQCMRPFDLRIEFGDPHVACPPWAFLPETWTAGESRAVPFSAR